jgi:hypothetical protein
MAIKKNIKDEMREKMMSMTKKMPVMRIKNAGYAKIKI